MKQTFYPALAAFLVVSASAVTAQPLFTTNFNTNQSANFTTVIGSSTNDASAVWTYDSTEHVKDADDPLNYTIGPAPSGTGTVGLRLQANQADSTAAQLDTINVYPTLTGVPGANWQATFDLWINYNGGAGGSSGSTLMFMFGATSSTSVVPHNFVAGSAIYPVTGDGFYFTMTGDGGAGQDYRLYSGTGTVARNDTGVSWLGGAAGANLNNLDDPWDAAGTGFFNNDVLGYQSAGAPGKKWHTLRLRVEGSSAYVDIKRVGVDANFVNIGTATVPATAKRFFLGWGDINATRPTQGTFLATDVQMMDNQFALIDNLTVENQVVPTAAGDWTIYN